ncbi:unnamed protein product [Brassica rapa subsp. narinosa]
MDQSSVVVEKPSQEPYISPPPIGYPTRDAAGGDPVVAAVETKSKGDDEFSYRRCFNKVCCCFTIFQACC